MDDKNLWWKNIPKRCVGDLVRYNNGHGTVSSDLYLVIEVNPTKPCRVHPEQHALCINKGGKTRWFRSKNLEVL